LRLAGLNLPAKASASSSSLCAMSVKALADLESRVLRASALACAAMIAISALEWVFMQALTVTYCRLLPTRCCLESCMGFMQFLPKRMACMRAWLH
jgi:hypothetical protein